jgi:hypothetical protein
VAFVVHASPLIWQELALHLRAPPAPGTQGCPPQQSVAVAHALPEATHPTPPSASPVYALQRGTPKGSRTHARNFGFCGPQQSARALDTPHV